MPLPACCHPAAAPPPVAVVVAVVAAAAAAPPPPAGPGTGRRWKRWPPPPTSATTRYAIWPAWKCVATPVSAHIQAHQPFSLYPQVLSFGLPGNASGMGVVPHIQAHQPPCPGALLARLEMRQRVEVPSHPGTPTLASTSSSSRGSFTICRWCAGRRRTPRCAVGLPGNAPTAPVWLTSRHANPLGVGPPGTPFDLPGNASGVGVAPHIQAHQLSLSLFVLPGALYARLDSQPTSTPS